MIMTLEKKNSVKCKSCVLDPIIHSLSLKIEHELNMIFEKELTSVDSIFVSISPTLTRRMARFISGEVKRAAAIGVCGETASGKSTIVNDAIELIEDFAKRLSTKKPTTRINTDDYYYDRSKEVKAAGSFAKFAQNYDLDVPEAIELTLMAEHVNRLLNDETVMLPKYDMSGTAIRIDECFEAKPSSIVIAEGLYALNEKISDIFDFKIYVDIDKEIQRKRFFERAKERKLGDSAEGIFENASKKAELYVHSCAKDADIIFNGAISREKYKKVIKEILSVVEAKYKNFAL